MLPATIDNELLGNRNNLRECVRALGLELGEIDLSQLTVSQCENCNVFAPKSEIKKHNGLCRICASFLD